MACCLLGPPFSAFDFSDSDQSSGDEDIDDLVLYNKKAKERGILKITNNLISKPKPKDSKIKEGQEKASFTYEDYIKSLGTEKNYTAKPLVEMNLKRTIQLC